MCVCVFKSSTPQSHIWFNTCHLPHAQAWPGRDACRGDTCDGSSLRVWPPVPLTMQLLLVQQCGGVDRGQRVLQTGGFAVICTTHTQMLITFSLLRRFRASFRDSALPQLGTLFFDIYAELLIPTLSSMSTISPQSLFFTLWNLYLLDNVFKRPLLHLPLDFEKLSTFSVPTSGSTFSFNRIPQQFSFSEGFLTFMVMGLDNSSLWGILLCILWCLVAPLTSTC